MLLAVDGLKVKTIRSTLGMSRRECCEKAGISEKTLQKIERGCNARPRTVRNVAKVLGIDPKALAKPLGRSECEG